MSCARPNEPASAQEAAEILLQLVGGTRRPRQDHARAFRARPGLLLQPRQAAQPGGRGARPSELGRAPPRRRQARRQHGDPEQARQADGRGMGAAAPPSPVRRDARRAAERMAGHLDRRGRVPPRELGRQGLPARHRRRRDPARRTDRRDRRRLRRDHLGAVVQGAREPNRSPRRARALRRDAVRPAPRARLREHLARQDAARAGPALVALTRAASRPPAADAVHRRVARRGRGHREHRRGRYSAHRAPRRLRPSAPQLRSSSQRSRARRPRRSRHPARQR